VARADATAPSGYVTVVESAVLGGWTVTLEVNGYEATSPGVAERLSAGGRRAGVGEPLPEVAQLTFGIDGPPVPASFAVIELLTGLRLTQEWLDDRTGWVGIGHRPR
jgi:hypothetical protein